jgi:ACR3 family arsenite transporter
MSAQCEVTARVAAQAPMSVFERYLTLWVFACILVGIAAGQLFPELFQAVGRMEVAKVNLPVGLLIWVMIIPMLMKVDFGALHEVRQHVRGIGVTLFVNWLVKPFSMALLAWIFIRHLFAPWLPAEQIDSYIAGLILLAAAPCTAMVFVWSRLTNGDPMFTLTQVAVNDAIMVVAFAPIVGLLLGIAAITVPWDTLITSVVLYIVIPVILGPMVAPVAPREGTGRLRCDDGEDRPVVDHGAAADAGAALRVPGRGDHRTAAGDRTPRGADPDPGVLQLLARLRAQPRTR